MYYILFLICLLSRILSSIYYIEDIDSLRFALSIIDDYDIAKYQPHFPGYAVYCFVAIVLYKITGSLAITASLIGGISTYFLIYFLLKILRIKIDSWQSIFIILTTFFNPMIWILGNRYMPDLLGMTIALASIYYISQKSNPQKINVGYFFTGILMGVRLSYFPLIIIPVFYSLKNKNHYHKYIFYFFCGLFIWFIPLIFSEGLFNLYKIGLSHTIGHFTDFGGTINTESNTLLRLKFLINTIWSDGLGGFWKNRTWNSLLISILIFGIFISTNYKMIKFSRIIKIYIFSCFIYLIWIFLFQNLIYKSRHVLPLVVLLLLIIGLLQKRNKHRLIFMLLPLFLSILTLNLIQSHREGTAIKFLKDHLEINKKDIIISNSLVNYYLKNNGISSNYINIENLKKEKVLDKSKNQENILMIGDYSQRFENEYNINLDTTFYHNPYINRMWSEIPIYSLIMKNEEK